MPGPTEPDARFDYDYLVIGSGFGGSVSALRLAEKGWRVGVLEMGKRWRPEDFPRTNWNLRKFLWMPRLRLFGIQQITLLRDVLVLHGAGVGGGSLVYANTLLVPPDRAFEDARWPGGGWRARLAPHYAMAKFMLGAVEAPEVFPGDEALRQAVDEETGRGHTFSRHTVAVHFGDAKRTAPDPYFGGEGPERIGCSLCGECMTGCRHGAKNTLDRNYLYLAERRGAEILPETLVTDLRPLAGGGWEVHTRSSTHVVRRNRRVLRARGVVLAAGAIGTVRLLLRCKAGGSLPALSGQLGNHVRTNSEALLAVTARRDDVDYSHGLAITSGLQADDDTHMEVVRYGAGHDFMSLLATHLTGGGPPWPRPLRWLGNLFRHPVDFFRAHWPFGWARRTAVLLVMQPLASHLRLRLARRPWGRSLTSALDGPRPPSYMPLANAVARRMAVKMDGVAQSGLHEVFLGASSTAHILGGATMGASPAEGVCDAQGRVFGYQDLFVADGSLVPANLGVNPSLTITALAEHVMSRIPANPAGEQRPAPRPPGGGA
ncbi:GMC oxidoreductase [Anaeromyxobacter sp. PSR-1]|uniref:GMC oxidoreductase n=1 Tax=unclassified Anaeromyxobacter TaxID=2620896 RepID=UPI0005DC478F|nr:GMC family oxidoreductase [Anaeromyxobacter sp. PSR-1]GAO02324.1 cholesterol oxidase [Anaeromyxobacter sp. PSR-1]